MKRRGIMIVVAAALATAACNEKETRSGQLTLSGSAPVRIADQNGTTVEFYSGPLTVEFNADGRDAKIKLDQSGRKAEFKARIPRNADWNLTLKGSEIGQPINLASTRKVEHYGKPERRWGPTRPCGMGGREQTIETVQKANEYWDVAFTDAQSGKAVAAFQSRILGYDDVIDTDYLGCVGEHDRGGRWDRMSTKLNELKDNGVKFD